MTSLLALAPIVLATLNGAPRITTPEEMASFAHNPNSLVQVSQEPSAVDVVFETEEAPDGSLCYVDEPTAKALSNVGFPVKAIEKGPGVAEYAYPVSKGTPKIIAA